MSSFQTVFEMNEDSFVMEGAVSWALGHCNDEKWQGTFGLGLPNGIKGPNWCKHA